MTIAVITTERRLALAIGQRLLLEGSRYEIVDLLSDTSARVKLVDLKVGEAEVNPYYAEPRKGKGDKAKQRSEWKRSMK